MMMIYRVITPQIDLRDRVNQTQLTSKQGEITERALMHHYGQDFRI